MVDFDVRHATEEDLPDMLRLWREMMDFHACVEPRFRPTPWPQGEQAWERYVRENVLASRDWCVFVAEADSRLIGQIVGVVRELVPVFEPARYGYVTDIVVDPAIRQSGVGRMLFEALKEWFYRRGVTHLQLQVAHNNTVSQAFWRAMGCTDYIDTLWYELEGK